MNKAILIFLLIFIFQFANATNDTTTVFGTIPSYADKELKIQYQRDPITKTNDILAVANVDSSGKFQFKFIIDKVYYAFIEKGALRGDFFLVPGKNYEITLPKYYQKKPEDLINPYFEPYEFYIKILNEAPRDLNNAIHQFDYDYAKFLDKHYQIISLQRGSARFDTIFQYFYNKNLTIRSSFFKNYVAYNIKNLQSSVLTQVPEQIFTKVLYEKRANFQNPAFVDFFNQNFAHFFKYFTNNPSFLKAINSSDDKTALNIIRNKDWLKSDTLIQYAFLKGMYDAFYEKSFSPDTLTSLLSNYLKNCKMPELHYSAKQLHAAFTRLKIGNPAPDFELYDRDSNITYLSDFKGYYVYLNFCSSKSFACVQQYGLLNGVKEKYLDSLKIITIAADGDFIPTRDYFRKNHFRWTLLSFANQPEVLKNYAIKAYPSYFLLDPEGKFLWAPAPGPNEDFAYKYYLMMKEIKRKESIEKNKNNSDFFDNN